MNERLFEATCGQCRRDGLEGPAARITGHGDLTGWRHDTAPVRKHRAEVTGTMRQIRTRKG